MDRQTQINRAFSMCVSLGEKGKVTRLKKQAIDYIMRIIKYVPWRRDSSREPRGFCITAKTDSRIKRMFLHGESLTQMLS